MDIKEVHCLKALAKLLKLAKSGNVYIADVPTGFFFLPVPGTLKVAAYNP